MGKSKKKWKKIDTSIIEENQIELKRKRDANKKYNHELYIIDKTPNNYINNKKYTIKGNAIQEKNVKLEKYLDKIIKNKKPCNYKINNINNESDEIIHDVWSDNNHDNSKKQKREVPLEASMKRSQHILTKTEGGQSYNQMQIDHQKLIADATEIEINNKIELKQAELYIEASNKLDDQHNITDTFIKDLDDKDNDDNYKINNIVTDKNRLTTVHKNKLQRLKKEKKLILDKRSNNILLHSYDGVKKITKNMNRKKNERLKFLSSKQTIKENLNKLEDKGLQLRKRKRKINDQQLNDKEVLLSDELCNKFTCIKHKGDILKDVQDSFLKRGMIEKITMQKNKEIEKLKEFNNKQSAFQLRKIKLPHERLKIKNSINELNMGKKSGLKIIK